MKIQRAILVICISLLCVNAVRAQTVAERVGDATAKYYGAVVVMKLISESKCNSSLKITRDEYDLSRVRPEINKKIARFTTKDELKQMQQFYTDTEAESRKEFLPMLQNANPDRCRQFVNEFSEMYYKHKSNWQSLTR
jgi:hypothetical protein